MNLLRLFAILLPFTMYTYGLDKGTYIGCYKYEGEQNGMESFFNAEDCVGRCAKNFKYAVFQTSKKNCFCSNFLGEMIDKISNNNCNDYSVFISQNNLAGRPKNFKVVSSTEQGVEISWERADNVTTINSYEITAIVIHTFSQYLVPNTTWVYSNDTFRTVLNLQPASTYNLTIRARSKEGISDPSSQIVETLLGLPDNKPHPPKILNRNGSEMTVKLFPVVNNNGPINYYLLIVLNEVVKGIFQPEYLKSYQDYSVEDNLQYYITAELAPFNNEIEFKVGDGKSYGKYFNAPLFASVGYNLIIGVVSTYNNLTKTTYSDPSMVYRDDKCNESSNMIDNNMSVTTILMVAAIVLLSILLLAGVVGFVFLQRHIQLKHRHNRLSEQELTLQGPIINVENSAYLPEEEQIPTDHYKQLKQRLRILSLGKELSVDAHSVIGKGTFGTICKAILNDYHSVIPVAAYCIPDKSLDSFQRKSMLKNLDMLIKCGEHDNIIHLVGTSESSHMLYVILGIFPMNLKQFLISNRIITQNKFCRISETQILGIITQISHGLAELEKHRVYHQQLCAQNIMLTDDFVPKIFGFGLADYTTERELDYIRWTAIEIIKGNNLTSRSPIWSFGILLWEICALGATPYSDISDTDELIDKISKGSRLPQLKYFSDDLHQIMLSCWQVDMGERPNSEDLCQLIENLHDNVIPFISFQLFQTFSFEQYKPEVEYKTY